MHTTTNFRKHTSSNPIQKYFIERFYASIFESVRTINPTTILDAGCGEGFMLERFRRLGIGTTLLGVDVSQDAIAIGQKLHPHLTIGYGDIYRLAYQDDSFDLVICSEVLEHLQYPDKAMAELVRVSKKYCLLSVPHEPFFTIVNFIRGKNWSRWGNDEGHINHWTKSAFISFVSFWFDKYSHSEAFPWQIVTCKVKN